MSAEPEVEEWRAVPGYEGLYEVSNRGRTRTLRRIIVSKKGVEIRLRGRLLKVRPDAKGYDLRPMRDHSGKIKWLHVHRLVLLAFRGPPGPRQIGRHLDDVKTNNNLSNLTWGTHKENVEDSFRNGTRSRRKPRVSKRRIIGPFATGEEMQWITSVFGGTKKDDGVGQGGITSCYPPWYKPKWLAAYEARAS